MIPGIVADALDPLAGAGGVPDTAYTTAAVHFNGSTFLTRGAVLTGWGSPTKYTWALWIKLTQANDGIFSDANYFTQGSTNDGLHDYFNVNINGTYFDSVGNSQIEVNSWRGFFVSVDQADYVNRIRMYVGDASVINNANTSLGSTGAIPAGSNFWFGQDGFGVKITGDVADFRLWLGQYLDLSIENNRRRFIRPNGKPADVVYSTDALGTPHISFKGNSSAFPINGGSGGLFSVTGTLTNASTSPTD